MVDRRIFNRSSPAFRAMQGATEVIFADIRSGGPWSRKVVAAKTCDQSGIGENCFDGPTRKPSLSERLRGLEPLPPIVVISWENDHALFLSTAGMPIGSHDFYEEFEVAESNWESIIPLLVESVGRAFESMDPRKTEAIKVHKMPRSVKENFPWMEAPERRPDPWNE